MKSLSISFFLLLAQICLAQSESSQQVSVIEVSEIVGVWTGSMGTFTPLQNADLSKGLGQHNSKTSSVPSNPSMLNYIVIDLFGNFTHSNYANAKWKIADHYLVVTTDFGKEIRGFLSPDSVTHEYRLTFEGHIFTREKKFDMDKK